MLPKSTHHYNQFKLYFYLKIIMEYCFVNRKFISKDEILNKVIIFILILPLLDQYTFTAHLV